MSAAVDQINEQLLRLDFRAEGLCDQLRRGEGDDLTLRPLLHATQKQINQLEAQLKGFANVSSEPPA